MSAGWPGALRVLALPYPFPPAAVACDAAGWAPRFVPFGSRAQGVTGRIDETLALFDALDAPYNVRHVARQAAKCATRPMLRCSTRQVFIHDLDQRRIARGEARDMIEGYE